MKTLPAGSQKILFGVRISASQLSRLRAFCRQNGGITQGFVIGEALDQFYKNYKSAVAPRVRSIKRTSAPK